MKNLIFLLVFLLSGCSSLPTLWPFGKDKDNCLETNSCESAAEVTRAASETWSCNGTSKSEGWKCARSSAPIFSDKPSSQGISSTSANQIDLFLTDKNNEDNILEKSEDWNFEERLSKEFQSIGFFISDHPINKYKEIFDDYKITDYKNFVSNNNAQETNIGATLLKVQERKTSKGNSYAIIKLTDLTSVFELFVFSEVLESNRSILIEGNSLLITLNKNTSNDENRFRRININKIVMLNDLYNKPISKIELTISQISKISKLNFLDENGDTDVIFNIIDKNRKFSFKLNQRRKVDRNILNLLKKEGITAQIN